MKKPLIGILTWRKGTRFLEPAYFRHLVREGRLLGAEVFLFSPQDVAVTGKKVRGFVPVDDRSWGEKVFQWPDVVIDRYRNLKPKSDFNQYKSFRGKSLFLYANHRLGSKWDVHLLLSEEPGLRRWLPETTTFSKSNLSKMLSRYSIVYVKPINGTGGKAILRVQRKENGYRLLGRDWARRRKAAKVRTYNELLQVTNHWVKDGKYLIQQGLLLDLVPGAVADVRLLIQKDKEGEWDITGMGMRRGGPRSSTSNLHGGGKAFHVTRLLQQNFSSERIDQILNECRELAHLTANTIEKRYGRMLELGLDIGIDVKGRVWLIEVNPKPGREIFRKLGQNEIYRRAVQRPLQYALYLAERRKEVSPL